MTAAATGGDSPDRLGRHTRPSEAASSPVSPTGDEKNGASVDQPYEIVETDSGPVYRVRARGNRIVREPLIFRGTAFTPEERS